MNDWMRAAGGSRKGRPLERARLPPVDHHASARYPARPPAAEESDDLADLRRRAETAKRNFAPDEGADFFPVGVQAPLPRPAGMQDATGRHRKDAYAARRELPGLFVGEADQRCLCRVVAHRPAAFAAPDARHVDDDGEIARRHAVGRRWGDESAFPRGGFEERQRLAGGANRRPEIPVERRPPARIFHGGPAGLAAADERHQHVESTQLLRGRSRRADDALGPLGVGHDGDGERRSLPAALRGPFLNALAGPRDERHRATFLRERPSRRGADPATGSDQQCPAPTEPEVHGRTLARPGRQKYEGPRRRAPRAFAKLLRTRTNYMPCVWPPMGPVSFHPASSLGFSATIASVVSIREATDDAFCSAVRDTFVGSITPAARRSSYWPVAALKP